MQQFGSDYTDVKQIDTNQYIDADGVLTTTETDIYDKNCCRPVKLKCGNEKQKRGETIQKCKADRGKLCCDSKNTGCTCTALKEYVRKQALKYSKLNNKKNNVLETNKDTKLKVEKETKINKINMFRSKQFNLNEEKVNPQCKDDNRW